MLKIRTATDADASMIAALIQQSFLKQARALAITVRDCPTYVAFETAAGVRLRIASGAHVALAYQGEEVVGTVTCVVHANESKPSEIMRLAVLPSRRGCGYGRDLMAYAENHLVAAGATVAELSIVAKFRRLQTYYEDQGYAVKDLKTVPSLPFELLFMQKVLA